MKTVRVLFEGTPVDADEMGFTVTGDGCTTVTVEDNTVVEMRQTVTAVYRLHQKDANGQLIYMVIAKGDMKKTPSGASAEIAE